MNNLLKSLIAFHLLFFFISCQDEKKTTHDNADSKNIKSELNIQNPTETKSTPNIIRSFGSQKNYGYDRDSTQLSQYIRRIFQDSKGNLWLGTTDDGVIYYNGKSIQYFTTREGFGGNCVTGIIEDRNGLIWFSTIGGITQFDGLKFRNYTVTDGLSTNDVWSILQDSKGTIWVGTSGGICYLEGEQFKPFKLPVLEVKNSTSELSPKLARCIFEDSKGNLWFGLDGYGICIYNPNQSTKSNSFIQYSQKDGLCSNNITSILEDNSGRIWISCRWCNVEGGVSCFDGKKFTNYNQKNGLNGTQVWNIYKDQKGNLWFANDGINKFDGKSFTSLHVKDGLSNTSVQSILEDKNGNIWLGTGAGLFIYNGYKVENLKLNEPWPKIFS
jgi:ligand-binding sensor domain-containing protein